MTWLVMLAVGAGSLALRVGPLLALRSAHLSPRADRSIRHAGLAAVAALAAGSAQHAATGSSTLPTLLALAAGGVLTVRGASLLRVVVVGTTVFAAATLALGLA